MESFKLGDICIHTLSGKHCMILEVFKRDNDSFHNGYFVRMQDDRYTVLKVFSFELMKREQ